MFSFSRQPTEPKYYAPTAANEIDFIVQNGMDIIPIEVKAGESVTSASFKSYLKEHKPVKAVRFSKLGYEHNDSFVNMPLYLANKMNKLL